jgi:hypothetical protein
MITNKNLSKHFGDVAVSKPPPISPPELEIDSQEYIN